MKTEDFDDTGLFADVAAAVDGIADGNPASGQTDGGDSKKEEQNTPAKIRGDDGKFISAGQNQPNKKADAENAEPGTDKSVDADQKTQDASQQKDSAQQQKQSMPAPANWRGGAKVNWAKLPPEVQKEIIDDYKRASVAEEELGRYRSAVGERAQSLSAQYGSVDRAIASLITVKEIADKNPIGFIQWFAKQSGIDLAQLGQGATQGEESSTSGQPHPLQQEIVTLRSQLQEMRQHFERAQTAPMQALIQSFQNDPAYPYFNDLRPHMKALIESGAVRGEGRELLDNAYKAAMWSSPDMRNRLLEDERRKADEANTAKIEKAKKAAGSITGAPKGAKPSDDAPNDEDIFATVARFIPRSVV